MKRKLRAIWHLLVSDEWLAVSLKSGEVSHSDCNASYKLVKAVVMVYQDELEATEAIAQAQSIIRS